MSIFIQCTFIEIPQILRHQHMQATFLHYNELIHENRDLLQYIHRNFIYSHFFEIKDDSLRS